MKKKVARSGETGQGGETSPHGAADFLPRRRSLPAARAAAAGCRGCDLYRRATQTVFGEGAADAEVMLIGETPGDREDLAGRPFVGPAGQLLDRALATAGIERKTVYVTNVVKHFKWEARGKRRLHKRPLPSEIGACLPWLHREIELVQPQVIVLLGATASQAILGSSFSVTRERGRFVSSRFAPFVLATLHPSALLRIREQSERHTAFERFVGDLSLVDSALRGKSQP